MAKPSYVQQDLAAIMRKYKCSLAEAWSRYNEQELEPNLANKYATDEA